MRAACFLLVLIMGCGDESSVVERPGEPAVVNVASDDDAMVAAIHQARDSVDGFLARLPTLRAKGEYYSVKVPVDTGSGIEHIWLDSPDYVDGAFHGKLGNTPLSGALKLGDVVTTPRDEISDWMAVSNGELFGGFSVILLRARLSPEEQAEFDASLGVPLPASARVFP